MIRPIEPGDREAWTQLWKAYLAFYETVLSDEVFASTWSRLLDPAEPTWGAFALQDGQPVGLVHWLYHRTNWAISDNCYLQDLSSPPRGAVAVMVVPSSSMSPPTRGPETARASIGIPTKPTRQRCSSMIAWPANLASSSTACRCHPRILRCRN